MTAPVLGALILQYLQAVDRFDRRMVIMAVAVMGGVAAGLATLFGKGEFALLLVCMRSMAAPSSRSIRSASRMRTTS